MTKIYMQIKTDKRVYTDILDLGMYLTSTDKQLNSYLCHMIVTMIPASEQVECSYIGSLKAWKRNGERLEV